MPPRAKVFGPLGIIGTLDATRDVYRDRQLIGEPLAEAAYATFRRRASRGRDVIRAYCRPGMPLVLRREPENPYDSNAVGVWIRTRVSVLRVGVADRVPQPQRRQGRSPSTLTPGGQSPLGLRK
jgi:HIRAN domain